MNVKMVKTLWITGLSGSGKTTIGKILERKLNFKDVRTVLLDGDVLRTGLNNNLGFSQEDRKENIRRASEVCKLFNKEKITVIACFISPYSEDRKMAKEIIGEGFTEIYVKASIDVCEKRDVKGLYAKARSGIIKGFTGIDAPYEVPDNPDIEVNTEEMDIDTSVNYILDRIDF